MKVILICILIFLTLPVAAQNSLLRQGNKAYDEGKFGQAFELYEKANKTPEKAAYNSGAALYKLQEYSSAANSFENSLKEPQNKDEAALNQNALYNLGNAAYKAGDKEKAKQAMRSAIMLNLNDKAAKQNLQFMLKEEKAQKQSQQQKENPQQKQEKDKKDKQQDKEKQDKQNQEQKQQQEQQNKQQEKEAAAKEEASSVLQMAQEHKQDLPKQEHRSNQIEKDW